MSLCNRLFSLPLNIIHQFKGELYIMKRLLTATPSEILKMNGRELLESIKMSEGRILRVAARVRGPNLVDGVTNAELVAACGADIINLDTYDIFDPYIPGWQSKKPSDDTQTADVQIKMGKGYTIREIEEIVGRPICLLLLVATSELGEKRTKEFYGNIVANDDTFLKVKEEGVKMIQIDFLSDGIDDSGPQKIKHIRELVGNDVIIQLSRSHGSGIMNMSNKRDLINEKEVVDFIDAGVDIIGFPAPGSFPGWDVETCKHYVDLAHSKGKVVILGVHTSQEGSNPSTLEQIALFSKMCGADMHDLGDCGFTENAIDPENIIRYGIAIRGKRHQYRRMAMSVKR